jgi:molecular chaperone GrpE
MHMRDSITEDSIAGDAAGLDIQSPQADQAQMIDRLQRALAESENLRKRVQRTAEDDRRFAISTFAVRMLMVEDNLRRTLEQVGAGNTAPAQSVLIAGVRATERILTDALEKSGVHRIDALGTRFDPNLHEAIMEIHDSDMASGHVAAVLEDGYMIHDRLLRPSRVSISKA